MAAPFIGKSRLQMSPPKTKEPNPAQSGIRLLIIFYAD